MNNRRDFLKLSGAIALGSLVTPTSLFASNARASQPIGIQLYSLRADMGTDPQGTLKKVAAIGYKSIESANYADGKVYGMEPTAFKTFTEDLGLKLTSAHLGGPQYTPETKSEAMDWWTKAIEDHKTIGTKYVIKPSMPIPQTLKELDVWCDYYNSIGALAEKSGMKFGFHNHAREFELIEGKLMYAHMLENTNPKNVCFQLDVYWCKKGGYDAVGLLNKYAGRFPVLHIKDEKELGESGDMDFKPIFEAAYAQGMQDYFVEVEKYNFEPIESVRQSFVFLDEAPYVK